MADFVVALDYSRPISSLLHQQTHSGIVHSVFQRAVNITLDNSPLTMLTLLSDAQPRMPNSVYIAAHAMQGLVRKLEPGMRVHSGNAELSIPICHCLIRLPNAPPWEPRPEITAYRWIPERIEQRVIQIARYFSEQSRLEGMAPLVRPLLLGQAIAMTPLLSKALPSLRLLLSASQRLDFTGVDDATRKLAGLGPGLTPSGDDVLAGFAAIMELVDPYTVAYSTKPQRAIAERIAATARSRTTTLSAALLAHAARGEVAEPVKDWLLALPSASLASILRATDGVLNIGSASGGDLLLGLLLGLRTIAGAFDNVGAYAWSFGHS